MLNKKTSKDFILNECLRAYALDPNLIGPTLPPIPPFTLPTGPLPPVACHLVNGPKVQTIRWTIHLQMLTIKPYVTVQQGLFHLDHLHFIKCGMTMQVQKGLL
ncbi:exosporium leader peptide-containing protein [Bacillus fungorum]|uniref:exosporium leader peptide-containing protein n=1 Tax=Bacillus fungorum TaxID=2039284 RepID=UPI003391692E